MAGPMIYTREHDGDTTGCTPGVDEKLDELIRQAESSSLSGGLDEAVALFRRVVRRAGRAGQPSLQAMAMRRLGNLYWRKGDPRRAMRYFRRSLRVSDSCGDVTGSAKAYNGIGTLYFNSGNWTKVKEYYNLAIESARQENDLTLVANVFNNLGAMSNILGDRNMAASYYEEAIDIYRQMRDYRGLARTYNNLGLTSRDRGDWENAARHYKHSTSIAQKLGDVSMTANATLNYVQVLIELEKFGEARDTCDGAYEIVSSTGEASGIAEAMMLYGMIYTRMEKWALAEKHFTDSLALNEKHNNVLGTAECYREMSLLYRAWGKNKKTLECLGRSFNAFKRLRAIRYLQDIDGKIADLEELTFKITRDMGAEVESKDTYTFGHSQRVAHYAVELAKRMSIENEQIKAIMVAAYLHDLGKVKVDREILLKERKLTPEEYYVIQMHPVWGVEILGDVDFPWEVKPFIRWHQERWDGSGYPDGLMGEDIPLGARIIAVADFFDALTTDRPYRSAYPLKQAVKIMKKEAGVSLDPGITKKFIRIVKERLPEDLSHSLSALSVPEFVEMWRGSAPEDPKPGDFLKRSVTLSSLVSLN